jgi:holin-like protein
VLNAITALLVLQLIGEVLSQIFQLPIPGPVVGMLLLFLILAMRASVPAWLRDTAHNMLQHLSLLFVPAGVGVMLHVQRVTDEWLAISLALVASTVLTIALTALATLAIARLLGTRRNGGQS